MTKNEITSLYGRSFYISKHCQTIYKVDVPIHFPTISTWEHILISLKKHILHTYYMPEAMLISDSANTTKGKNLLLRTFQSNRQDRLINESKKNIL